MKRERESALTETGFRKKKKKKGVRASLSFILVFSDATIIGN